MTTMTLVHGDDWSGVYIDGRLEREGHSIQPDDAVNMALKHKVSNFEQKFCDPDWLYGEGCLPQSLDDVKMEA